MLRKVGASLEGPLAAFETRASERGQAVVYLLEGMRVLAMGPVLMSLSTVIVALNAQLLRRATL